MDSLNKWQRDFLKGKQDREVIVNILNDFFQKNCPGIKIVREHEHLKSMTVQEKVKNNTIENRWNSSPFYNAMGLDYLICKGKAKVPLMIRFSNDAGFYLKLPKECLKDREAMVRYLEFLEFDYVLFVRRDKSGVTADICGPTPFMNILNNCNCSKMDAIGNTNRLQFSYKPKDTDYHPYDEVSMLGDSFLNRILELMK
jgi:hypothetical protein